MLCKVGGVSFGSGAFAGVGPAPTCGVPAIGLGGIAFFGNLGTGGRFGGTSGAPGGLGTCGNFGEGTSGGPGAAGAPAGADTG